MAMVTRRFRWPLFFLGLLAGLGVAYAVPLTPRISSVVVLSEGDITLGVSNPSGVGVAALTTGTAEAFHLGANADGGGYRITGAAPGLASGQSITHTTQPFTSASFTGSLPNPTLTEPVLNATLEVPALSQTAGTCWEDTVAVSGAEAGDVAIASPTGAIYSSGWTYAARVSGADEVSVRVCAIVTSTAGERTMLVSVVQ